MAGLHNRFLRSAGTDWAESAAGIRRVPPVEPGGTAWAESVDGIRWIPPVQPGGTAWAESADRIRAIPPVEAEVRGLERHRGLGASIGGVAKRRRGARKSAAVAYSQ